MARDETRLSLMLRLRDPNDGEAWAEFDQTYRDLVLSYLERRGMNAPDAEEIYSNVLVTMNRSWARFEYRAERGSFRSYLRRAVDNAVRSWWRQGRNGPSRLETSLQDSLTGASESDAELHRGFEEEWRGFHYRRAMVALRREYDRRSLEVFECLVGGESVAEVATRMAMSEQAVHKVKQRFRDRMREIIRRQVEEEDGA